MDVVTITHPDARDRGIYPTGAACDLWESRGYDVTEARKAANKASKAVKKKGSTD